ncbi:hypothetical protein O6P43_013365 [Quillaja saponaria]|uniref:Uncharacterized protein n=1 Tax=Quillaja saponaria TaxID=32244 RepID=A0AAD7M5G4_QUISA|nr:hypothetical protein O6P43_013365 [Quillaja saponaria]
MAKSLRSKREKRLRAIRREMVEPLYESKDAAKLAAQQAALEAPKLPVRPSPNSAMELTNTMDNAISTSTAPSNNMDVEMADPGQSAGSLKPVGGIGKKSKRKFKMGKGKRRSKGGFRKKRNI